MGVDGRFSKRSYANSDTVSFFLLFSFLGITSLM